MVYEISQEVVSKPSSELTMWVDAEQNNVVSSEPLAGGAHVRHVFEHSEKQCNLDLRGGLLELYSRG